MENFKFLVMEENDFENLDVKIGKIFDIFHRSRIRIEKRWKKHTH